LFLIPKKNIARIGAWADILTRMMASPVDFLSEYFHRNVCVRAVFLLTRAGLAELSGRKEKKDNK
jgi:transposase